MFAYKDFLFVAGGAMGGKPASMKKLHRLDLKTLVWDVVTTKGPKPSSRYESAAHVYKDTLYMFGGDDTQFFGLGDLWSLNLNTFKWNLLSNSGILGRKAHGMWAAKGKLYVYGGTALIPPETTAANAVSIRSFARFDLQSMEWEKLWCAGDDPWRLSEYCCLPLYAGQEEPYAVVIFGGYRERGMGGLSGSSSTEIYEAKYGDEMKDAGLPYRRRLLRLVCLL